LSNNNEKEVTCKEIRNNISMNPKWCMQEHKYNSKKYNLKTDFDVLSCYIKENVKK
jgi:hypothetical protein